MKIWCDEKIIPVLRILSAARFVLVVPLDLDGIAPPAAAIAVPDVSKHLPEPGEHHGFRIRCFINFPGGSRGICLAVALPNGPIGPDERS